MRLGEIKLYQIWFIAYGAYLALSGVAGYLSNPAEAKTALFTGGGFGALAILAGVFHCKLPKATFWCSVALVIVLLGAFTWRSTVSWQAYLAGDPKLFAAILITLMGVVTIAMALFLFLQHRSSVIFSAVSKK